MRPVPRDFVACWGRPQKDRVLRTDRCEAPRSDRFALDLAALAPASFHRSATSVEACLDRLAWASRSTDRCEAHLEASSLALRLLFQIQRVAHRRSLDQPRAHSRPAVREARVEPRAQHRSRVQPTALSVRSRAAYSRAPSRAQAQDLWEVVRCFPLRPLAKGVGLDLAKWRPTAQAPRAEAATARCRANLRQLPAGTLPVRLPRVPRDAVGTPRTQSSSSSSRCSRRYRV